MLDRLAQVIHWIGFIISAFFAVFFIVGLAINLADSIQMDADTMRAFAQLAYYALGALPVAWVIRFILTGHKGLMPWSKYNQ